MTNSDDCSVSLNRRNFLTALGAAGTGLMLAPEAAAARMPRTKGKPNILVILADDLGYADVGVYGHQDIPTPHIDSLAHNGVRFTNGYVSCPVCSPTRAGLMTGRYQQRFGHELNPGPKNPPHPAFGLPLEEKTLAERLKPMGYATGLVGKWHLGYSTEKQPMSRGFDEFYGFLHGAHPYFDIYDKEDRPVLRGSTPVADLDYTTDAFGREAVDFIDRHKEHPFFLYLAFNAVHGPLEAPDRYRERVAHIADPKRRTFAAMLVALDDNIGRVLDKLNESGLDDDTLIFFLSDNGGPTANNTSVNCPLRGYKSDLYEGGIRVPFIIQWKKHLAKGRVEDSPVISLDICPTALAAAQYDIVPQYQFDGVDLMPYLDKNPKQAPHDALYWRYGKKWAVRIGDWKLVNETPDTAALYNLAEDVSETQNRAHEFPQRITEMTAIYNAWNEKNIPPRWDTSR